MKDVAIPAVKNPDMVTRRTEMENKYVTGAVFKAELQNFINNEWLPKVAPAEQAYQRIMAARK